MEKSEFLTCLSPAKLNLFLHITGRRADGYHTLQTYFQLLDYGDQLNFKRLETPDIQLMTSLYPKRMDFRGGVERSNPQEHSMSYVTEVRSDDNKPLNSFDKGIDQVAEQDNLIYKAAKLLQQQSRTHFGAQIQLDKKIPLGAGLGGGSSNAGATLVALNYLWQTEFSCSELQQLGVQLGADVPLFVLGQSAWAEGIGEQLMPLKSPSAWFLVVTPNIHVSTQEIFRHPRLTRNTPPIRVSTAHKEEGETFLEAAQHNDCELLVCELYPEIAEVLKWLRAFGAARLTGTGASCFVDFATEAEAAKVKKRLPSHWQSFIARGISTTPLHQMISSV